MKCYEVYDTITEECMDFGTMEELAEYDDGTTRYTFIECEDGEAEGW